MQTRRNLVRGALGYVNGFRVTGADRVGFTASVGMAQGVIAAFSTLLAGATLCLFDLRTSGLAGLWPWLARDEITYLIIAVPVFRRAEGVRVVLRLRAHGHAGLALPRNPPPAEQAPGSPVSQGKASGPVRLAALLGVRIRG